MNIANREQKEAIEHQGGVLLQAGAGSGKTFVLVEHVCYLISLFIKKNKGLELSHFEELIKKYFHSIVLMTFTNKASGELSIRLQKRIKKEQMSGPYKKQWEIARLQSGKIFVGTIHRFCLKLISEGHFTEVSLSTHLISRNELRVFFNDAFKGFLIQNALDNEVLKVIRANKDSLLESMTDIFLDPSLRINWERRSAEKMLDYSFIDTLKALFDLQGVSDIFRQTPWDIEKKDQGKKWAIYLREAERISFPRDIEDLKAHKVFFQSYKNLPPRPKNKGDELIRHFENLKKYRDFLYKNCESFAAYEENKNGVVLQWCQWLKKIFIHLSQSYERIEGITFSDFEYIVLKGLENKNVRKKISRQYQHLIVDEFQDTSRIQFKIIRYVINDDLTKLFVVGDVKQAIYGFRGGEISVFQDCLSRIPRTLELKNNYRSLPNIITFNNLFFSDIFQQNLEFRGEIKWQVPISHQRVPLERDYGFLGKVEVRVREVEGKEKLKNAEINYLEANEIGDYLMALEDGPETKTTCVLYKKLAPSLELLKQIFSSGMSFTAQVKIPLEEAPILLLFYRLIEGYLANRNSDSTLFLVNGIFFYLSFGPPLNSKQLENFYSLLEEIGPYYAYIKFLFERGISHSLVENDLSFMRSILEVCHDDLERFYLCFKKSKDETFSFEFQVGHHPKKIQIMTVHASKGLEFDHVILAGIQTNGTRRTQTPIFGKSPGSFCWKKDEGQIKFYESPLLILERWENKYKDFSEDQRLFYVAATRAKERLTWIDFSFSQSSYSPPRSSWIYAFHSELSSGTKNLIRNKTLEGSKGGSQKTPQQTTLPRPFFHQAPLGVLPAREKSEDILLLGELSVTGISMLAQCPRKFYLRNILKIFPEDVGEIGPLEGVSFGKKSLSSAERGSKIHLDLSQIIQNNLLIPVEKTSEFELLRWARDQLLPYKTDQLISERPLKFPLFGLMVSGIPDLIIKGPQKTMIWDFKTGSQGEDNERYWLQLKLYALALWQLGDVDKNDPIELSLLYLDEKAKLSLIISFHQVKAEFFLQWELSNSPHQVNRHHCPLCDYGKLCRF